MIKTSELTGAQLDYWTARAEGIPAEQLTIRRVQRSTAYHVVRTDWGTYDAAPVRITVVAYSTDWAQGGPLILKTGGVDAWCRNGVMENTYWQAPPGYDVPDPSEGDTPLQAICRAVVRAAFGDEVEEVAVCE